MRDAFLTEACLLHALLLFVPSATAAGDAKRGAQVFRACVACHSIVAGEHMTGPSLASAWNQKAATVKGFARYSDALRRAEVTWNEDALDRWLQSPESFIPGTTMTFPGIKEARQREDVIAYLKAVAENRAPAPTQGAEAMAGMGGGMKRPLRTAPPEAQVKSINYCGDTYTVRTADGKTHKIWEFNLRLKSDSSKDGPAAGNPVMVGAGMQGDRASIVFAAPQEISPFIKTSCP